MARRLIISMAAASLLMTPAPAMASDSLQPGAFVGARFRLSFAKRTEARPLVGLAIAPTMSRISSDGRRRTTFGEGLALNFGKRAKPSLTLAGAPAAETLRLESGGKAATGRRLGVSDLGWVAIGLSTAAAAGGIYLLIQFEEYRRSEDPS